MFFQNQWCYIEACVLPLLPLGSAFIKENHHHEGEAILISYCGRRLCSFSESGPFWLKYCCFCKITGACIKARALEPVQVVQTPNLTHLSLSNPSFNSPGLPFAASQLRSLELLYTSSLPQMACILSTSLTSLVLSSANLSGYSLESDNSPLDLYALSRFSPNLQHVRIDDCLLYDHGLRPFVGLSRWNLDRVRRSFHS